MLALQLLWRRLFPSCMEAAKGTDGKVPSTFCSPRVAPVDYLCKTRPVSKDYQRIFLIDCRESFSGVQFALGSFLCPKPVTSLWSSEHLFGQTNPP